MDGPASPWRLLVTLGLLLSASATAPSGAVGQAAEAAPQEAIDHYREGRAHFAAGRYEEAVDELEAALELDPGSPNLLYNVAFASELAGDLDRSIEYYEQYLEALPKHQRRERRKTRETLERLRARAALVDARAGGDDPLFWVVLGGGVGLLTAGAIAGGLSTEHDGEAREGLTTASHVMLISGAAAVAGAALLYVLRPGREETAAPAAPPGPAVGASTDGRSLILQLRAQF